MEGNGKHRLLVVDDDALVCTMLKDYFEGAGYDVDAVQEPTEALAKLSRSYDAILSDVMMPKTSGIDLLQQLRTKAPSTLVFLITAFPSLDTLNAAKKYGAVAYFRKPLKLDEVEARIRGFLEETPGSPVGGRVLVVGKALYDQLADRLVRFHPLACEPAEPALLQAVGEHRPKAVLADAGAPETPDLLRAYLRLGPEANSFLLVADDAALDAASDLLFGQGAAGCVPLGANRETVERAINEAVQAREMHKLDEQGQVDEQTDKCMFAKTYRNGYYCLKQGPCPYGAFQGSWISIEGKEFHKCAKRPLLVNSLSQVGFAAWNGRVEPNQAMECRKKLMALVRERKRELVINAQGLEVTHYNLFEILADIYGELVKVHPDGLIHVINLSPSLQDEFRKAVIQKGIRFYGVRMIDEQSSFQRWGSRFH